jgi:hypothetical protein
MNEKLVDAAKEYREVQNRIEEIEEQIDNFRQQTFGGGSKHTEEKARELFSDVSSADNGSSTTQELNKIQEEHTELTEKLAGLESNVLEKLVKVRFPLDETIQGNEPPVEFPFIESIDPTVLDAISSALGEDIREGTVHIQTDAIIVETASIDDAIEAVHDEISDIRERADANLNVPEQVQKVKDRDPKVAAILYSLYENNNEPMMKAEMEDAIGLDRGDLRGQLYHVLENDPYLNKRDEGFSLKPNGTKVIDRFVDKYGIPELFAEDQDSEEDEETAGTGEGSDQEVTAYE